MIITDCVLDLKRYWAPFGSVIPPANWPDVSREQTDLPDGAGAAEPDWEQLPSGIWVKEYDGNDYSTLAISNWRDVDYQGTIMCWVKSSVATGDQTLFASSDTGIDDTNFLQLRLAQTTGFLEIVQRDGGALNQVTGDVGCVDGAFHHVVVTGDINAGAWILYVDGVTQGLTVTAGLNTGNWFAAIFDVRLG